MLKAYSTDRLNLIMALAEVITDMIEAGQPPAVCWAGRTAHDLLGVGDGEVASIGGVDIIFLREERADTSVFLLRERDLWEGLSWIPVN